MSPHGVEVDAGMSLCKEEHQPHLMATPVESFLDLPGVELHVESTPLQKDFEGAYGEVQAYEELEVVCELGL